MHSMHPVFPAKKAGSTGRQTDDLLNRNGGNDFFRARRTAETMFPKGFPAFQKGLFLRGKQSFWVSVAISAFFGLFMALVFPVY